MICVYEGDRTLAAALAGPTRWVMGFSRGPFQVWLS